MSISEEENEAVLNPQFKFELNCTKLNYRTNEKIERGGKLLLPLWVLDSIYYMNIPSPYFFKLTNETNLCFSHAGVLEFTADEEEQVCVPFWLMKHLGLKEGDKVTVESVSLPSATYLKLEPLTRNTAYISDPKAVMEDNFQNFFCLTEGDILSIYETNYNKIYKLKVAKTKPESAISICNCDVTLDMDLPEKFNRKKICKLFEEVTLEPKESFPGKGYRLNGKSDETSEDDCEHYSSKNSKKRKYEQTFTKSSTEEETKDKQSKESKVIEGEPQIKRHCSKKKEDNLTNQLICIREKQKEFAKQNQSSGNSKRFPGKGQSLKDK